MKFKFQLQFIYNNYFISTYTKYMTISTTHFQLGIIIFRNFLKIGEPSREQHLRQKPEKVLRKFPKNKPKFSKW